MSEATELVLRQGFRGEEIQGTAFLVMHKRIKCGQVIAQGLAAGAGCRYYHVFPGKGDIQSFCLVTIKSGYPQGFQTCLEAGVEGAIQFAEHSTLMRNPFNVDNLLAVIS